MYCMHGNWPETVHEVCLTLLQPKNMSRILNDHTKSCSIFTTTATSANVFIRCFYPTRSQYRSDLYRYRTTHLAVAGRPGNTPCPACLCGIVDFFRKLSAASQSITSTQPTSYMFRPASSFPLQWFCSNMFCPLNQLFFTEISI